MQGARAGDPSARPNDAGEVIASVADHVAELVLVCDPLGTVLSVNAAVRRILGREPGDWVGRHAGELAHPDDVALGMELLVSAQATGAGVKEPVVYRLAHADGTWVDLEVISSNVELADGSLVLVVSGRPAGQVRPSEAVVGEVSDRLAAMFDEARIGMAQVSLDGRFLRVNPALAELVGRRPDELVHEAVADHVVAEDRPALAGLVAACDDGTAPAEGWLELRLDGPAGLRVARVSCSLVRDRLGEPMYHALQAADVTDLVAAREALREARDELLHRSTHDHLTGLANRSLLETWRHPGTGALPTVALFVDLDGFKSVNDAHGHRVGDLVLQRVADRIRAAVGYDDLVARLGGDEFAVVGRVPGAGVADALAGRVVAAIAEPIVIDGVAHQVGASAGVAFDPAGVDVAELLHRADLAQYAAKRAGGGRSVSAGP